MVVMVVDVDDSTVDVDDVIVLIDDISLGVIGPADCGPGVKPGWLIDFCRTSRIFNCKLCLFGNISRCFICKNGIQSLGAVRIFDVQCVRNRNAPETHLYLLSWETCHNC